VQAADGHTARVGMLRVNSEGIVLDPVRQFVNLLLAGAFLTRRGHDPGTHVLENRPPEIRLAAEILGILEPVEGDPPLAGSVPVAGVAVKLQHGLDALSVSLLDRLIRAAGSDSL